MNDDYNDGGIQTNNDGSWEVNSTPEPTPTPEPEPLPVKVTIREKTLEYKPEEVDVELVLKLTKEIGWKRFDVKVKKVGGTFSAVNVSALDELEAGDEVKITAYTEHG